MLVDMVNQHKATSRVVVVDENDNVIGVKDRSAITHSDIYRVSSLWVKNSAGDVLLAQRKHTKKHDPGKWGPAAAGTIEEGETYQSNIVHEAQEEIGLQNIAPKSGPKVRVRGEYNFFDQWYILTVDKAASDFTISEEEVEQVKWFTRAELADELQKRPEQFLPDIGWALETL